MLTIDTDVLFLPKQYINDASTVWQTSKKGCKGANKKQKTSGTSGTSETAGSSGTAGASGTFNAYETDEISGVIQSDQLATNPDLDSSVVAIADILNDPDKIYNTLMTMPGSNLVNMLFFVDKDNLVMGLNFFNKDKLLNFINDLPKEQIINMLRTTFSNKNLIKQFQRSDVQGFLESSKINQNDYLKAFETLPNYTLTKILEASTGERVGNLSQDELLSKLNKLGQESFVDGVTSLSLEDTGNIAKTLTENNPDSFTGFSKEALLRPLQKMEKGEIADCMSALDTDTLIKLLGQLPNQLLAAIDTTIDPKILSILLNG